MLELKNINCRLGGSNILNIEELNIDKPGLYVILGPSGCGKTTLLNIITGLNKDYCGSVTIFNRPFSKLKDYEIIRFRSSHMSIFFQHNVYLEDLTLGDNISLTGLNNNPSLQNLVSQKTTKVANKLGIEKLLNAKIKTLSGGEKTRGAIARTLSKNVPLYIFDEPTAALDEENGKAVMKLIKEKARQSIVIVVTHDERLAYRFADVIYKMEYGKIISETKLNNEIEICNFTGGKYLDYDKNADYIAKKLLKANKIRNLFTSFSVNIGLVGLGISLLLVSAINTKLVDSFKGDFNENSVYIEKKFSPTLNTIKSVSEEQITIDLGGDYSVGSLYLNDFDSFFPTYNRLCYTNATNNDFYLPSFDASIFNEPILLQEIQTETYPYVSSLADDEIGLVLPFDDFKLLQNALQLPFKNNGNDLGYYLSVNNVVLTLEMGNANWDYFDEQIFRLKTIVLGQNAQVIVSDLSFVTTLFESKMQFPSSLNLSKIEEYPWTLKKINYIYTPAKEQFLWDNVYKSNYLIFTANHDYFGVIFDKHYLNARFLILESPPTFNDVLDIDYINEASCVTFDGGLNFVSEMMLLGFSGNFFVSKESYLVEEIIKADMNETEVVTPQLSLSEGLLNFALPYNSFGSFNYSGGNYGYSLNEIGISSALALKLFGTKDVVGQFLYVGALTSISETSEGYDKHYVQVILMIKDVIKNDQVVFYHHPMWAYLLFKDVFNILPFYLEINGVIFSELASDRLTYLNSVFKVSKPYEIFKSTINATLNDLEKYTLVVSCGAFILSAIIIFMVIYLLIAETSEQFSALFLMGYSKNAIHEVVASYIIRLLGYIILLAIGQLFLFSFLVEYILMDYLKTPFHYVFDYKPYIFVFIFSAILMFSLLVYFRRQINKVDLLAFSKRDL